MRQILSLFTLLTITVVVSEAKANSYNKDYVGEMEVHRAVFEDTLVHLARWNNLGFVEMMAANPDLDPWIPGAGARVVLPKQHILPNARRKGIVINLPEMHLFYFPKDGSEPEVHSIGIGREGLKTPLGVTSVVRKKAGPTWRPTQRMKDEDPSLPDVVPAGPDNPLGTHAIYLGWPTYAIHGTNKPYGIGRRISSGCIRMYPETIKELFERVPVGTRVEVVDQPVKAGWIDDKMYIEVHPTQDQAIEVEKLQDLASYEMTADDMKLILEKAGAFTDHIDWENVREAVARRSGYPVAILDKNVKAGNRVKDDFQALLLEANTNAEDVYTVVKPENMPDLLRSGNDEGLLSEASALDEKDAEDVGSIYPRDDESEQQPSKRPRYSRSIQSWQN